MSLEKPILNIFNCEKKLVKANGLYSTNYNKKKPKRLHRRSWSFFFLIFKNAKFWFFDFCQNIYLEVVLSTSKQKKWMIWIILSISCPENFFHRTFNFFSKRAWKFSKILKIGFFENICFFWKNAILRIFKPF